MTEWYNDFEAVTPSDTVDGPFAAERGTFFDALYVGGSGNVSIVNERNRAVSFVGLSAGIMLRVRGRRVNSTGTTATNLVALRRE